MNRASLLAALAGSLTFASLAGAYDASAVVIEVIGNDGRVFREFPVAARDGALRSYLQAEKGARYGIRVRNVTGERLGLVIAVDGRNIIDGRKSELARGEPMYVLDPFATDDYAGWRANLHAINEFYFTDWSDSYAEAFGDRSARGVIAVAVYREVPPPRIDRRDHELSRARDPGPAAAAAPAEKSARRDASSESAGTGYGDRRTDHAVEVEFVARSQADSRHFIKYEWRETLCRKRVASCAEESGPNRFWDESVLGFAPPPRRH